MDKGGDVGKVSGAAKDQSRKGRNGAKAKGCNGNGAAKTNGLNGNGAAMTNGHNGNGALRINGYPWNAARGNGFDPTNGDHCSNGATAANGTADMGLIDDATPFVPAIAPEMDFARSRSSDSSLLIEQRLESYEMIIDSEVGDTTMARARNIEREIGLRQIYLKFEGGNPTGTQKDRIAFAQCLDALRRGYDHVTVATCGNYGSAVALAASLAGLRCIVFIPESYHTKRGEEISAHGAEIRLVRGDYEDAVALSTEEARTYDYYDANPGGKNTQLQLSTYGAIAYEIYDDLRDAPAVVAVPVSNGTTIAGIYRGFLSLYRRGKTSRIPVMVAGSSYRKNPIVQAFISGSPACEDLEKESIRETAVNEPLINWHSSDGDLALEAIRASHGWAGFASDKKLTACSKLLLEREGLSVLPASTAGFIAMADRHVREPFPGDRYVVIMTGRKA